MAAHPDQGILAAYVDGRLPAANADEVAAHVASCPACREAIQAVPDDDPLVLLLRSLPDEMRSAARADDIPAALRDHPRYEVLEEVGRGGMGVVYKARHKILDREVAVKLIRNPASPAAAQRFLREARAAARLDHPNVVRVHEAEEHAGQLLLVMEYVEGTDLALLVRERGPLPADEACGYARQAALGLQHAHERGLVHHDAKPSNLILASGGVVKVLDFGLASLLGQDGPAPASPDADTPDGGSLTVIRGRGMGTPDYVAPEQALEAALADIRSDIYSLGCTLFHLLAGRPPFDAGDISRRVLGHMVRTPRPIREIRPDVPVGLALVIEKMMEKDPAARFQTPAEAADALAPFAAPPRPTRRWLLLAGGAALAAGLAGLAWWLTRPRYAREQVRLERHGGGVHAGAVSPDGRLVLTGCEDRRLRLFDIDSGEKVQEFEAHDNWVQCLAWMPDGRHALSGSTDGTLRLWGVREGRLVTRFPDVEATVLCVAASPDGSRILTGSDSRLVRLLDAATGRLLHDLKGHAMPVQCVAFTPDGRLGVSGGNDRVIRVWDLDTGRLVRRLEGHAHVVTGLLPLPGGRVLSCCADNTTRLWDLEAGTQPAAREYALWPSWPFAVGGRLLVACRDEAGGLRLHDAESGEEVCRFSGHRDPVWAMALSPDGSRAVSADRGGVVIVWGLPEA